MLRKVGLETTPVGLMFGHKPLTQNLQMMWGRGLCKLVPVTQ